MDFFNFKYKAACLNIFCLAFVAGLAADIYWPAINLLRKDFNCSQLATQISMGINFLFPAVVGFLYGIIGDKLGKKLSLLIGTFIILIGNLGCYLASNIYVFNFSRCIEGIGLGGISIISSAILLDMHNLKDGARLISINGTMLALGLILSPVIGSLLIKYFNWKLGFLIIIALCILLLHNLYKYIPSSVIKKNNEKKIFNKVKVLFKEKDFIYNNIILGLPMSALFAMNIALPFYYINQIKMNPLLFSYHKSFGPILCLIVSFYVRKTMKIFGTTQTIKQGIFCTIIGAGSLLIILMYSDNNPYIITFCISFYSLLFPFLFPTIVAENLSFFPEIKSISSAICYSIRTLFIWIGTIISAFIYNDTLYPISIFMLISSILSYIIYKLKNNNSIIKC